MKTRFNTVDIRATICELRNRFLGMRVANVYDIDNKTYLIKLTKPDFKAVLLLESGNRLHSTEFDWPKNVSPSGFSMKLRKHLRTRRLETVDQLGIDRIVDLQFGSGEAAYHVVLELYDRGNIALTDHEYTILNLLRPRTDESQDVRYAVRERYPVENARQHRGAPSEEELRALLLGAKEGDNLKKTLNPHLVYGPALIEHSLLEVGLPDNAKLGTTFNISSDLPSLVSALEIAERALEQTSKGTLKGYIITKKEKKVSQLEGEPEVITTYVEFHPILYKQHQNLSHEEYDSFDKAVDEFFSKLGTQKLDLKVLQQEKAALKKLENVKRDHEKRLEALKHDQDLDTMKAELIEMNLQLVDRAIVIVQSALANQIDWGEIDGLVKEAQAQDDPVAAAIKALKLDTNHIVMLLRYPFADSDDEESSEEYKPLKVDIDLSLSAYGNARRYYDMKRHAFKKEQKTVDASQKALKSAERKTKETLKEVATVASINKARKTYWFEKFLWFVSSENFLVIGGRDQQQNEYIYKRYLKPGDLYVHADLHGASSVVIKNPSGEPVPPKTLNEAGTMAVCNSAAWDAKVVTSAWWVYHHQVSKTAPTGEYLTTGSFMVRGKKNFLPPSYLVYGFGFLFKLDEDSLFRHRDERRIRVGEDDMMSVTESVTDSVITETDLSEASADREADIEDSADSDSECEGDDKPGGSVSSLGVKQEVLDPEAPDATCSKTEDSGSNDNSLFPDTTIELQHVKGDKFTLQRNVSTMSSADTEEEKIIYLGDDQPLVLGEKSSKTSGKLSAKQRRELKKQARRGHDGETANQATEIPEHPPAETACSQKSAKPQPQQEQLPQAKRGQKAKQKKIREKYKDQDEEEREMRMKILASAGGPKEDKKAKKGKKGKQKEQQQQQRQQQQQQQQQGKVSGGKLLPPRRVTAEDITVETLTLEDGDVLLENPGEVKPAVNPADVEEDMSDEEKQNVLEEENLRGVEDAGILDSLTGQPVEDDTLLFCVPVCAPYSSLINYKHKVKLTPGTTRRGKAAKTALHSFMHDKLSTIREKELLRSVKDGDLSRNIPGKVKVSAPNLHKHKGK